MPRPQLAAAIALVLLGLLSAGAVFPFGDDVRLPEGTAGEDRASAPWRLVVYFDGVLASDRSVARAARVLAEEAGALSALGSVEVVLAAPEPAARLGPTRDPKLVAEALEELARGPLQAGDLLRHRDELRRALRDAARAEPGGLRYRVVAAARTEQEAIHQSLERLLRWLGRSTAEGRRGPKALLWIADGFDLSPAAVLPDWVPNRAVRARLRDDLSEYDSTASVAGLAEGLARAGWVAVPVSMGLRPFGLSTGDDPFADPREPLRRVAEATGGQIAARGEVHGAVARFARRRHPLRAAGPAPPGTPSPRGRGCGGESRIPLPPAVARGAGLTDPAALGLEDAKPLYLLPLDEPMATGRTLIAAQALRPEVAAVAFQVGEEEPRTDREPPFEVTVKLPMIPRPTTVRAVALDAAGSELGGDAMEINAFEGELGLSIREPRRIPGPGRYEVDLEVRTPRGAGVASVELSWSGERFETLHHPPYRATLVVPPDAESGYLQATAALPDGRTREAVLTLGREGFGERVDVDLVQLPTVVRDRRGRPVPGLGPDDFRVREEGREKRLRTFGSAADTPLAVGLTVDVSTSLEEDLPLVKEAAIRFLRGVLRPGDRGQLVAFAGRPWLAAPVTREPDRLARAVGRLSAAPSTALYDGLMLSLFHLRGVSGRKAVVLLTDGRDTRSQHGSYQCSRFARRTGIPVYVIALGSPVPRTASARLQRSVLTRLTTATGASSTSCRAWISSSRLTTRSPRSFGTSTC